MQGIRNELFSSDICRVVALDEIKGHFPSGTTFEDYWPAKGSIEPVNPHARANVGNWTQKPPNQHGGAAAGGQQPQPPQQQHNGMAAAAAAAAATQRHYGRSQAASSATTTSSAAAAQQQAIAAMAAAAAGYGGNAAANDPYQQFLRSAQHAAAAFSTMQQALGHQAYAASSRDTYYQQTLQAQQQLLQQQQQHAAAAVAAAAAVPKPFQGRLTQIKEFPVEGSVSHQPPYKLQKALIDQKIVPCINVRPYVFHDLMMTLPDFVRHFCPNSLNIERATQILQDILKIVLYKGNK